MSHASTGMIVAIVASVTLGAAHFASGHDLAGIQAQFQDPALTTGINRASKSDRAAARDSATAMHTISLRSHGLADTSVLVRVPVIRESRPPSVLPVTQKPPQNSAARKTVACEPVVSVLTEIAKSLQPGRCIT